MFEKLNFSWVIPDVLAASSVPHFKKDLDFLLRKQGIEVVITLTENNLSKYIKNYKELKTNYQYKHYHIPTIDGTGFFIHQFEKIVKILEENISQNKKILIHCEGGYGRTSTVLVAFWISHYNKALKDSINELKKEERRPQLILTDIQIESLKEWEKIVFRNK